MPHIYYIYKHTQTDMNMPTFTAPTPSHNHMIHACMHTHTQLHQPSCPQILTPHTHTHTAHTCISLSLSLSLLLCSSHPLSPLFFSPSSCVCLSLSLSLSPSLSLSLSL